VPCPGLQFERFGDSLGQVVFGHRGVDLDGSQFTDPDSRDASC
jgi:hypothetical protein